MSSTQAAGKRMLHAVPTIGDSPQDIARDLSAIARVAAIPTLLDVLCEITGMRFAAVARVTDHSWTACAVKDDIDFGLKPGDQLAVETTLCAEAKKSQDIIVVDHAAIDPLYKHHPTPKQYNVESYVSVPIVMPSGRYFGSLCAIDPAPANVSNPKILKMFRRFAGLIAQQLDTELARERDATALIDERTASELREQYIAILGHDLRNPLQAVLATSELLSRKLSDPVSAGMASRIKTNAKRMSCLIDDVLDFARGRLGGGITIDLAETDIAQGLHSVVSVLQDGQPTRRIETSISVAGPVRCDLGRLQQVASNLIGNALTHGGIHSAVRLSATTDDRDLVLDVWNDGEPIPPDSIGKVFEPFWRRDLGKNGQGLGLGLHICLQIVRAHGGLLSVSSTREGGTSFTARFPLNHLTTDEPPGENSLAAPLIPAWPAERRV